MGQLLDGDVDGARDVRLSKLIGGANVQEERALTDEIAARNVREASGGHHR